MIAYVGLTVACVVLGLRLGMGVTSPTTAVTVAAIAWVVPMSLVPYLVSADRRNRAEYAAILEAAGFPRSTGPSGRPRYLPPHSQ
ncbi:hypothetical protein [Streptomyces sp. NPDC001508]|uniref:hypothetical protein n=1 Tax=Streptomyces sp. NPDC001508 TaxID=3154656 RepID=UPI00331C3E65